MTIKDFIKRDFSNKSPKVQYFIRRNQDYLKSLNLPEHILNIDLLSNVLTNYRLDILTIDQILVLGQKKPPRRKNLKKTLDSPNYWKKYKIDKMIFDFALFELKLAGIEFNPRNPSPRALEILNSWGIKVRKIKNKEAV